MTKFGLTSEYVSHRYLAMVIRMTSSFSLKAFTQRLETSSQGSYSENLHTVLPERVIMWIFHYHFGQDSSALFLIFLHLKMISISLSPLKTPLVFSNHCVSPNQASCIFRHPQKNFSWWKIKDKEMPSSFQSYQEMVRLN